MHRTSAAILAAVLLAAAVFLVPVVAQTGDVAVIVNPANSTSNLTVADLRKILVGERHAWHGGMPVKLVASAPGTHERVVLLKIAGMSDSDYKQYWSAQVFRGEADSEPLTLPSFGMILEATRAFPGAIALVDARFVKPDMATKVLRIEGRLPGEAGYPLR